VPIQLSQLVLNPPLNIQVVENEEQLEELCSFLDSQKIVGLDIETTPTKDFWWRRCRTIQFGNVDHQFVIDLLSFCDGDSQLLFDCQGEYGKKLNLAPKLEQLIKKLVPYLCSGKNLLCGCNLGFEYSVFYFNFGLRTWNFYDCMLAEKCIYAGFASLKNYSFFSLEEMMARYFHVEIDKSLQESFTLDGELTQGQYEYAALDTRLPIAIKNAQNIIITGQTIESRKKQGLGTTLLERLNPVILGDNLEEVVQIENDAIGAFVDMHLHGEYIDHDKWMKRIEKRKIELKEVVDKLDEVFIPLVGKKETPPTQEEVNLAEEQYKTFKNVTDEELSLKGQARKDKKVEREIQKDYYKKIYQELKSKATKKSLKEYEGCEGEALINYGSSAQLLKVLVTMKGLKGLKDTNDETLEKHAEIPVIDLIRTYREISKDINTYGESWVTCWTTKPGKEEGWLNPNDKKLHSKFNQYDAETGRSSSEAPNGQNIPHDPATRSCFIAEPGFQYVTLDMSGAELCILAEESKEPVWIKAFNNNEDVHCICADLVDHENWLRLALPNCAYFLNKDGKIQRKKCKCPEHDSLRNEMKPTNFGLPYGIGPRKLAGQIKKSYQDTLDLLRKHRNAFPTLWLYLENSGKMAKIQKKSFDMFGRRRLFLEPTWDRAKDKAKEDRFDRLEFPLEVQKKNKEVFIEIHKRKPNKDELWYLTHREPNSHEVGNAFQAMYGSTERQGKNHRIQAANASIIKLAMGYIWHELPKYNAKLIKMVHDELVTQVPLEYSETVAKLEQEAIRKAAAVHMKLVEMRSEYNIASYWKK
jgi:DNA polymerase I-like protein with 3'-5' exonuclease and polymerase domains